MIVPHIRTIFFGVALIVSSMGYIAAAKPVARKATATSGTCTRLYADMEHLKKSLAMNFADGIGDNSAPRATMREAQDQSLMARVRLTMDLMRDNHCRMPTTVPTGVEYASSAISCRTDQMSSGSLNPPSCVQDKWVPRQHRSD